jgi:hypothetical protein
MDPLFAKSLVSFWSGLLLIVIGFLLDPPSITIAIEPEDD